MSAISYTLGTLPDCLAQIQSCTCSHADCFGLPLCSLVFGSTRGVSNVSVQSTTNS